MMPTGLRSQKCSYCDVPWPREKDYETCPICREPTEGSATFPIASELAAERKHSADFGWYLWDTGQL